MPNAERCAPQMCAETRLYEGARRLSVDRWERVWPKGTQGNPNGRGQHRGISVWMRSLGNTALTSRWPRWGAYKVEFVDLGRFNRLTLAVDL